jgi:hypothetical protein
LFDKVVEAVQLDLLRYYINNDLETKEIGAKIQKTNIIIDGRE